MDKYIILGIVIVILVILFSPITYNIINRIWRKIKNKLLLKSTAEEKVAIVQEIQLAIDTLIENEKGATIVIDTRNETQEYVNSSEEIDSKITSNLIINIFEGSKTPLHDGAIIIKNNRIDRASSYITKLSEQSVPKKFGTRHRSALGLSEVTKAIIIVLSEEDSSIKLFHNSKWEEISSKELFSKVINLWK